MSSSLVEAVRAVQTAIDLDNRHQYAEAVAKYDEALRFFGRGRDELAQHDPVGAVAVATKMEEYASRAKVLRDALAQNPFHSPAPSSSGGLGLTYAAPIPGVGGSPAPASQPYTAPPPSTDLGGYHEMPASRAVNPIPAPVEYPAHMTAAGAASPAQAHSLPVHVQPGMHYTPPPSQPLFSMPAKPPAPSTAPITRSKEQDFLGHKNKMKFVVSLPRYAERLRPGEVINVDVMLDNPTGCVVSCIKITLMKTFTGVNVKTESFKVKSDEYIQGGRFPMKEEKYQGSLEFALPSDLAPTVAISHGPHSVLCTYDLHVKAVVKRHDDVELIFPIVIANRV